MKLHLFGLASRFASLAATVSTLSLATLAGTVALVPVNAIAQTITTDTNGLTAGEVKVPTKDGEMPAYRAMPAEGGPFPDRKSVV